MPEEKNGSLLLTDDDGKSLRRHVSQTKKVHKWRSPVIKSFTNEGVSSRENLVDQQGEVSLHKRSSRDRKPPSYFKDYVRSVQEDNV